MNTIVGALEDVPLHAVVAISRTKVRLTDEHLLDIFFVGSISVG